ncbi:MAG TPA: energy transducer TonB [Verrucomicrobiae bacterium]|nr:energy transducer TonB [Verrucomicrobiae bacterium]
MPKTAIALALVMALMPGLVIAQQPAHPSAPDRKVISRVQPQYPELAKRMQIRGTVKVEAIVRPNGTVKTARLLGGNPVLADAALGAVQKWKFEPGENETTEVVQLTFDSQ